MYNILFVGYGVMGQYEASRLAKLKPDVYDKYKPEVNTVRDIKYDLAFVAVPTDTIDGKCDLTNVENAIKNTDAEVIVIKSTVSPGSTREFAAKYGKRLVFSPEFSGVTQHAKDFPQNFTILGGKREDCHYVQQILQHVFNATHYFKIVDFETAELTKYMINCFLATKISFCNAFWEAAHQFGVDYDEMRECVLLDERIGRPHTFVYDDAPYWDSHCFNKDYPAIANLTNNEFMLGVVDYNNHMKKKYGK